VGGRAAPEVSLDVFSVFGRKITPVFLASFNGKEDFITGDKTAREVEERARNFFSREGGSGLLAGYLIQAKDYLKICAPRTLSSTLEAGKMIQGKKIKKLIESINGYCLKEKIKTVRLVNKKGFLQGRVDLERMEIIIKNENLKLMNKEGVIAQAPELIVVLNKNFIPIHNTEISSAVGQEVFIVVAPAQYYWQKDSSKKMWDKTM
jgi:hypothetical protein